MTCWPGLSCRRTLAGWYHVLAEVFQAVHRDDPGGDFLGNPSRQPTPEQGAPALPDGVWEHQRAAERDHIGLTHWALLLGFGTFDAA